MSTPVYNGETYPDRSFSVSQLLYAAKRKLEEVTLGGRCVRNRSHDISDRQNTTPQGCDDRGLESSEAKRELSVHVLRGSHVVLGGHF